MFYLIVCPPGFFINSNNGDACERCPADTFSGSTDTASCQNCPSGTNTQDQTGQTSVAACGKFHYSLQTGVHSLKVSFLRRVSDLGAWRLENEVGEGWNEPGDAIPLLGELILLFYGSMAILSFLLSCFFLVHTNLVCPSGSYLNANNNNACEVCPVNTHSNGTNINECMPCPSGTNTQEQTGQTTENSCGKTRLFTWGVQFDEILCRFMFNSFFCLPIKVKFKCWISMSFSVPDPTTTTQVSKKWWTIKTSK